VYEGVSKLSTMFFSFFRKISLVLIICQVLNNYFYVQLSDFNNILLVLGFFSILIGCIFALGQIKIKRLLAFSGIAQIGYLVMIMANSSNQSFFSINVYLFFYIVSVILLWTNILILAKEDFLFISDFVGNSKKNYIFSVTITLILLSLAGLPPLSGFLGKFLVLIELLNQNIFFMVVLVALVSSIAILYYINLIYISFFKSIGNYSYNKILLTVKKTFSVNFYYLFGFHTVLLIVLFSFINLNFILPTIFKYTLLFTI